MNHSEFLKQFIKLLVVRLIADNEQQKQGMTHIIDFQIF